MHTMQRILVNGLLLIVALACVALLLEFLVRVTGLQPMDRDPDLHRGASGGLVFELIPSLRARGYNRETVTTNALGFRSPPIEPAKPVIAVLGDSMTFGFGVEDDETNPAVLQEAFPSFHVLNAGVSSYNIEQEVLTYEQKVARLDPALVILEFVLNDADPKAHIAPGGGWTTEDLTPAEAEERLRRAITKEGTWRIPGKVFLHKNSALFTFLERRTKGMWFRAKTQLVDVEWTPAQMVYFEWWFERLSADVGGRPKLFVRWPDNWLHPRTVLALDRLAQDRGWHVIDLADLFGTRYPTLGWDQHPTAAAQRTAAEVMAAYILREKLLSPSLPADGGAVR